MGGEGEHRDPVPTGAAAMPAWGRDELPDPPPFKLDPLRLIGPGLLMAGGAIGAGEWLMGPAVTATYGGAVMWIATLSILLQAVFNLEVMRYTLYCGEPIFVGFFRSLPGPRFWTVVYLIFDFGAVWPYLAANAGTTLVAAYLGRAPGEAGTEVTYVWLAGYFVFLAAFVPLIFGGKIYNTLERIMFAKIIIVLGYLLFLGVFYVEAGTWYEIFTGFVRFGSLPVVDGEQVTWSQVFTFNGETEAPIDLALMAGFAAIAGIGGLTNTTFSNYCREKGWGMGKNVGAIPSMIGGKGITLSHHGRVFPVDAANHERWRRWRNITIRDQFGIWVIGCILGVGIPALVSLQYVRGKEVTQNNVAAMTATELAKETGIPFFLYATLFCGFLVLWTSQISTVDGLVRRWTDVLWTASPKMRKLKDDKVAYVYYTILFGYALWGLFVLTMIPKPLTLVKGSGVLLNFALGFAALHTLAVNCLLLPKQLRPNWLIRVGLVGTAIFFIGISAIGTPRMIQDIKEAGLFGN